MADDDNVAGELTSLVDDSWDDDVKHQRRLVSLLHGQIFNVDSSDSI